LWISSSFFSNVSVDNIYWIGRRRCHGLGLVFAGQKSRERSAMFSQWSCDRVFDYTCGQWSYMGHERDPIQSTPGTSVTFFFSLLFFLSSSL
jgi:hypothetical protein